MKTKEKYSIAIVMLLSCMLVGNVRADMASLDQLLSGGTLSDGTTIYSNFQLLADIGTIAIDPAEITVETLSFSGGLEFQGNGQLNLDAGNDSIIYQIGFDAVAFDTSWAGIGANIGDGNAIVGGDGLIDLFNQSSDPFGASLGNANAILDPSFDINVETGFASFADLQTDVRIVSSLSLFSDQASSVSLDSYQVTLSAVPEPTAAGLIGLISIATVCRRTRRSRI